MKTILSALVVVLAVFATVIVAAGYGFDAGAAQQALLLGDGQWADSSFDRCMNVTIENAGASTLTNFPALVNLTYDSDMQANYADLRFYDQPCDANGNMIDYEIENYTASNALIWARVPSLTAPNATISVYYKNNTPVSSGQNAAGVWDTDYLMVQHLEESGTGTRYDSTKYGRNGTPTNFDNNEKTTGVVDGADDLDGASTGDYIQTTANVTSANNITFEAWFNSDNTGLRHIMWQGNSGGNGWGAQGEMHISTGVYSGSGINNQLSFYLGTDNLPNANLISINKSFTDTASFHYAAFAVSNLGSSPAGTAYLDGAVFGTDAGTVAGVSRSDWNTNLRIGQAGTGTGRYFDGIVDEVRVSNVTRSAEWINQSYQMVYNNSRRVKFGAEESKPAETPQLSWNQSALDLGSVFPSSSDAKNATVIASGSHTSVAVTAISGTNIITAYPLSLGDMDDAQTQEVRFNCSPSAEQTSGYYEAVFKVNSSEDAEGDDITVNCTVVAPSLSWNQSSVSIGTVVGGQSSAKNATVIASGSHTSVAVTAISGSGTGFITAYPLSLGGMEDGQTQEVRFNCSPDESQELGYYEAVFKVNSSEDAEGDDITAGCTVGPQVMHNFTISVSYTRNDSWFGETIVNATVKDESAQPVTGASVSLTVTPPTGKFVYPRTVAMKDDGIAPDVAADDGIYTVLFDISINGSAETNGTHSLNVSAAKAGFNSKHNDSRAFYTFIIRRWYGSSTQDVYADYKITYLGNGLWLHNVTDVRIYSLNTAANNVSVKIPILNQNISNLTYRGTSAGSYIKGNNTIVLYLNVTSGGTTMVNYSFLGSSDLVLTLNDKYQTQTIGERIGKNGFVIWNSHIQKEVFGIGLASEGSDSSSGQHAVGEDVGMKVVNGESADSQSHTVDCMERTGIVENSTGTMAYSTCASCGSYYEWNIHWKNPENSGYAHMGGEIIEATNETVTLRMTDHGSTNEWGSTNRYNVTKVITFYAGKNYEKLNFTITNINAAPLNTTLVWGREPWVHSGGAADTNDKGATPKSWPLGTEEDYTWGELGSNWIGFYDSVTNYGTAIIFRTNTSADAATMCAHMDADHTPLGTNSGQNDWPWTIDHAAFSNGYADDIFCNWQFGTLAPGQSRSVVLYHLGGYNTSANGLMAEMAASALEIDEMNS